MTDTGKEEKPLVTNAEKTVMALAGTTSLLAVCANNYLHDRESVVSFFKNAYTLLQNPEISFKLTAFLSGQATDVLAPIAVFFCSYSAIILAQTFEKKTMKKDTSVNKSKNDAFMYSVISTTMYVLFFIALELSSTTNALKKTEGEFRDLIAFSPILVTNIIYLLRNDRLGTLKETLGLNEKKRDKTD